ncbi:hypothetical protein D3C86_2146650 [compost metagenome]
MLFIVSDKDRKDGAKGLFHGKLLISRNVTENVRWKYETGRRAPRQLFETGALRIVNFA